MCENDNKDISVLIYIFYYLFTKKRNCGGMILVVGEKALGEPTPELLAAANALLNCRTKTHVAATTTPTAFGGIRIPWSYNQPTLTQYKQYERVPSHLLDNMDFDYGSHEVKVILGIMKI